MTTFLPGAALAQDRVLSLSFDLSNFDRDGDATGPAEPNSHESLAIGGLGAYGLGAGLRLTWDAALEYHDTGVTRNAQTLHGQLDLSLGSNFGSSYAGGFLTLATNQFETQRDGDHDALTYGLGVSGAHHFGPFSVDGTLGATRVSSDGEEVMDELWFVSVGGTYYLNGGNTALGLDLAHGRGDQDFDFAPPGDVDIDDMEVTQLSLSAEHMLGTQMFGGNASLYAEASRIWVEEQNDPGSTDEVQENRFTIGFRILFGADNLQARDQARAPALPEIARWQAIAPALD